METTNKVLLVDGMALLFRGYFANAYGGFIRKTRTGIPTNAVYGFLKYWTDAIQTFKPSHVICCWDMGSSTFRTGMYGGYKANRPDAPDELIPQFDLVKEVVASFGVPNIGIKGYEADDCIGTLAEHFSQESEVVILTGDHDLLQLVSERVKVAIMKKGVSNYTVYSPHTLFEEKQLTPKQFIDLKGLTGDTSDNYPGVRGIGEKIAAKLLQDHASIEGILANLSELPKGVRAKIEADIDMLHLSRDLATIRCDAPVACGLDTSQWNPDFAVAKNKLTELEMHRLLDGLLT